MQINGAKAMIKCLEAEKTDVIFGYPGASICPFYHALTESKIRHILVRNEVNAGHSASGYARISGKVGVCVTTSGPASTNLITAISTAYADSIPLVIITGQVATNLIGKDVFQEADITGAVEPFIKHSFLVKNASEIPEIFKKAFYIASTGRQGPVLIDVPIDVQNDTLNFIYPKNVTIRSYKPTTKGNSLQIKRIVSELKTAKKPLLCVGGGVISSNSQEEIFALSKKVDIPIVSTLVAVSAFDKSDKNYIGMIGVFGDKVANDAVFEADLLIVVGARLGERTILENSEKSPQKIVHIDIDPAEIGKNQAVDIPIVGDAKVVLTQLLELVCEKNNSSWQLPEKSINTAKKVLIKDNFVNPHAFVERVSEIFQNNAIITADVGQNLLWCAKNYNFKGAKFLISAGMGTMGYALPAAIGAKIADKSKTVICFCGDGGFMMSMCELATVLECNLPLKIVIFNNSSLGLVREIQKNSFDKNYSQTNIISPDYIKLAEAFSINAIRVIDEITGEKALKLMQDEQSCLVELVVSQDESTLDLTKEDF